MGTLYGEQATLECQQRKTRRRSPAPALMLIPPVVKPPAGGAAGTRNIMSCKFHPAQQWRENTWGAAGLPGAGTMPYW